MTEDWDKDENLQVNRVLGKRADCNRTKDILLKLAVKAGTSLDEIVHHRGLVAKRSKELLELKNQYSSMVTKFSNQLLKYDQS